MDESLTLRGTCRRCKAPLIKVITKLPIYRCMAECSHCLYRTVLRDDPIELPIREALQPYFSDDYIENIFSGFKDPQDAFINSIEALLSKASEMIEQNRVIATAGLLYLMNDLDNSMKQHFTDQYYEEMNSDSVALTAKNQACQLLFLLLARAGSVELPRENIHTGIVSKIVGQQIFPLLTDIVTLAKMILPALFEQSIEIQMNNGKLLVKKLLKHDLMVETSINMLLQEKRENISNNHEQISTLDMLMPEHARHAVSIATGIDIEVLVEILNNRMSILVERRIGIQQGNLFMIADQYLANEEKEMFQRLSLTHEKIYRFQIPCFFDTGPFRDEGDTTLKPIAESAAINWSAYYPCYKFSSPVNGSAIYVTSPRRWQGFLMTLPQSKGYLLNQLNKVYSSSLSEIKRSELRKLIHETHRDLEQQAADQATLSGWKCLRGVERFNNSPIPCGEIDLLATTVVKNIRIILVGEVKDNDVALFKPGGFARLQELVDHAEQQLKRKGNWIRENWMEVLKIFEPLETAPVKHYFIAHLVITSRPIMPHFFNEFTGCSIEGLESLCSELRRNDPATWQNQWQISLQEIKK